MPDEYLLRLMEKEDGHSIDIHVTGVIPDDYLNHHKDNIFDFLNNNNNFN